MKLAAFPEEVLDEMALEQYDSCADEMFLYREGDRRF